MGFSIINILSRTALAIVLSIILSITLSSCSLITPLVETPTISTTKLSTYTETCVDESCAEISAYDVDTSRVFTTNGEENELRILALDNVGNLTEFKVIDLSAFGGGPNSVAVSGGYVAVAMEANIKQDLSSSL